MSFVEIREAIAARFRTQVTGVQIVQANQDPPPLGDRWVQMQVEFLSTTQVGTGSENARRWRIAGRVALNLYERNGSGDGSMLALMDAITTAFRGVTIGSVGVSFGAPTFLGVSVRDEAVAHWRMPAQIPFRADVIG